MSTQTCRRWLGLLLIVFGTTSTLAHSQVPSPAQAQQMLKDNPALIARLQQMLRTSGLTPEQIRQRLRAQGYSPGRRRTQPRFRATTSLPPSALWVSPIRRNSIRSVRRHAEHG